MKRSFLTLASLLLLATFGCEDDDPIPCLLLFRPVDPDTAEVPTSGTETAFFELNVINEGTSTFTGTVQTSLDTTVAEPPDILVTPTNITILGRDSLVVSVTVIVEPTTSTGNYTINFDFGPECDDAQAELVVQDVEAAVLPRRF